MIMRILISAYACSPYDGSERAVGWNWITELDKYHTIIALTSSKYKKDIEDYLYKNPETLKNTKFIYIDVPNTSWHVGYRLERLYYILWQKEALKIAKKITSREEFDLVHHITYVTCILPTYMYKLNLPFLYGPVSGGENTPSVIHYPMTKKDKFVETVRRMSQTLFSNTLNYHKTMEKATLILTTTEETKNSIPEKYHNKIQVFQSIGLRKDMFFPEPDKRENKIPQFLMAGRMLYWKGFELGIVAFVKALKDGVNAELTVLGDTEGNPDYERHMEKLKMMCEEYLENKIYFVSTVPHDKMKSFYDEFDVLLNCSLRDSGCFVVMEAMSRSLPVICVNTGGPRVNTTNKTAIKIEPAPMAKMIDECSKAITDLATDSSRRKMMGSLGRKYALEHFMISERTKMMNEYYEIVVRKYKE